MNSSALLKKFKSAYTPMEDNASVLPFYMHNYKGSGAFEKGAVLLILDSEYTSPIVKHFIENNNRSYIKLYTEFMSKWNSFESHFANFSKDFVFEKIKEVIDSFLSFNPGYITFDLTDDCSVFFQASINNFNVYYELFFTNDVKGQVEAVMNIYKEGNCIFAFGGPIEDAFQKLKLKVVVNQNISDSNIESTLSAYVLPEPSFTPTGL